MNHENVAVPDRVCELLAVLGQLCLVNIVDKARNERMRLVIVRFRRCAQVCMEDEALEWCGVSVVFRRRMFRNE